MVKSVERLRKANVTGFQKIGILPFIGSFLWACLLVGIKIFILFSDMWNFQGIDYIIYVALGLNISTFIWQSIDALYTDFKLWFVTALNWMSQLSSIAISGSLIPLSLSVSENNKDTRLFISILLLIGECLYTASQFSVTLEYIHRSLEKNGHNHVLQTVTTIANTVPSQKERRKN